MTAGRLLRGWRARHRRLVRDGEAGTSMIELFAAMIIMTICGAIFTGAIVSLFKAANQAQAITSSSQQDNQAFQSLDRTVRYAAAISPPGLGSPSADWYVELRNTTDGTERCSQLRLDIVSGQLQRRTWLASDLTTLSTWLPLASGLTNGSAISTSADRPFVIKPAASSANHQVVTVTLIARAGTRNQPVSTRSSFDLTAVNSTNPVATGPICQQAGRP